MINFNSLVLISIKIKYKITQFQNFIININCCEMIIRLFTLLVLYLIFWFLLSGHFDPLFIFLGIVSSLLCVYVSWKANFLDNEGVPLHLFLKLPHYILWLTIEILKANLDTAKIILFNNPKPLCFKVKFSQKTVSGRVAYANSITLTPGTVTIQMDDETLEVHALSPEMAEDIKSGFMDKKVSQLEIVK